MSLLFEEESESFFALAYFVYCLEILQETLGYLHLALGLNSLLELSSSSTSRITSIFSSVWSGELSSNLSSYSVEFLDSEIIIRLVIFSLFV